MAKKIKKIDRQEILRLLVIVFSFVLPLILLVFALYWTTRPGVIKKEPGKKLIRLEEWLTPSQILNNKGKYHQQKIVIRGKVVLAPVVCLRKECPSNDPCCGCPSERHLVIVNQGAVLTSETKGQLRLLNPTGKPFCQRRQGSCDYECQDWLKGAIYDVGGEFFSEPPPWGWRLSLEYYFLVESKNKVRTIGFGESLGNIIKDIKAMIKQLTTTGYYVLP